VVPSLTAQSGSDWIPLFDGKTLNGWKVAGPPESFKIVDGHLAAGGPTAHLFYAGPIQNARFRNFELQLEVMVAPHANSGVYFHTAYQESGWPEQGFEVQVNNTATGEGSYRERKRTGSLYGVRNVYKALARDNEWFTLRVAVRGKQIQVVLNGMLVVDYVEPDPAVHAPNTPGRVLGSGTFALQCHDRGSKAFFRNIRVRPLPDSLVSLSDPPKADDIDREILRLSAANYPLVDFHVHLKSGWTIEDALRQARRSGIGYGVAVNCGKNFSVQNDSQASAFLDAMRPHPVFIGMQAEGREWVGMFSKDTVASFDYVFSDAMTFTDDNGRRMRTWIASEVGEIPDRQKFMDTVVARTLGILSKEPIDIWANPSYLPDAISAAYDELWTEQRMDRVIEAAKENDVAIEINNRYRIPRPAFIRRAKRAGVKFALGSNNTDHNIGRSEYGIQMIRECGLTWQDMFVPKSDGEKPVQKKGLPAAA
jgi:hypothetical protein